MRNREIILTKLERVKGRLQYMDGQIQRMDHSTYVENSNEIKGLIEEIERYVNAETLSAQEMNPHI